MVPPGARNYLTPDGERRLREELDRLVQTDRPRVAELPDDGDRKRQLGALDQRIDHLHRSLQSAVVVLPSESPPDHVRFGVTVTVRDRTGERTPYRIVGVDEVDIDRGWLSWLSPIARALLTARVGQRVRLKLPSGDEELEVISITND